MDKCRQCSTNLPCGAVFAVGLSGINDGVFIIAGALFRQHTHSIVSHVGSFCTATAIHYTEADLTGVVSLTEGAAGTATGGHVVAIHSICCTTSKAAWNGQNENVDIRYKLEETDPLTVTLHMPPYPHKSITNAKLTTDGRSPVTNVNSCCRTCVYI